MNSLFQLDENRIDEQSKKLFIYWRNEGFPNYEKDKYNAKTELSKIESYDDSKIISGKDLKQTMLGCGFLWTYFPHWINIKCSNDLSLLDNWNDDKKLMQLIQKTCVYELKHGNGTFTINRLRQNAKVYCSKQSVSNFRPTVAKYIYNTYGNSGTVWDMSAGFGGRLLGFFGSNCKKYVGTEPSTLTYNGLLQMKKDYAYTGKEVELHCIGSEAYEPERNSIDLCFTSPPYFDTEKYSNEPTQSYIKYPTCNEWLNGFLGETIKNCFNGLKNTGRLILNIANVKTFPNLEEEATRIAQNNGFVLDDTLYLILSSIAGKGIKREPVFIFRKKGI